MNHEQYHVSSLVVQAVAAKAEQVMQYILSIEGAEIPISNNDGKMVVVIDGNSTEVLADKFNKISNFRAILSATMVFHQVDEF